MERARKDKEMNENPYMYMIDPKFMEAMEEEEVKKDGKKDKKKSAKIKS